MSSHSIRLAVPDAALRGWCGVDLWVKGVHYPPERGFTIRVFLNRPEADVSTPTADNPHYVGRGTVMARKHFQESIARGLPPWADPSVPREPDPPLSFRLDATEQVKKLAGDRSWVTVTLVLVDSFGHEVPDEALHYEGVELLATGERPGSPRP